MSRIVVTFGLSFLVTLVFMFALRPVAEAVGLVDRPGGRKAHVGEIPIIGGLAMFPGLALGGILGFAAIDQFAFFFSAVLLLVSVGAIDDRFDLPASIRLLAQTCAVLVMMIGADVHVTHIGSVFSDSALNLNGFSGIFTVLIALTAINAFNMFDGSDGIAGIQGFVALLLMAGLCVASMNLTSVPLITGALGCILGFLAFNWPSRFTAPIRCFMGDAGSTMLGFLLAWLSIQLSQGSSAVMSPVTTLWIFTLPLFDFFSSMLRRSIAGRSPFHGDSDHLHHILRRFGLSSRRVAQLILGAGGGFGLMGVAGYSFGVPDTVMFVSWMTLGAIYHMVFGSGLILNRRTVDGSEEATSQSGSYPSLWRREH